MIQVAVLEDCAERPESWPLGRLLQALWRQVYESAGPDAPSIEASYEDKALSEDMTLGVLAALTGDEGQVRFGPDDVRITATGRDSFWADYLASSFESFDQWSESIDRETKRVRADFAKGNDLAVEDVVAVCDICGIITGDKPGDLTFGQHLVGFHLSESEHASVLAVMDRDTFPEWCATVFEARQGNE